MENWKLLAGLSRLIFLLLLCVCVCVWICLFFTLPVLMFVINAVYHTQVSSVTDHVGSQDTTAKSADFDDDEGGLVSLHLY